LRLNLWEILGCRAPLHLAGRNYGLKGMRFVLLIWCLFVGASDGEAVGDAALN
jgi:hypothetical protein